MGFTGSTRQRRRRGQAVAELALLAPLYALITLLLIFFSEIGIGLTKLHLAAREVAWSCEDQNAWNSSQLSDYYFGGRKGAFHLFEQLQAEGDSLDPFYQSIDASGDAAGRIAIYAADALSYVDCEVRACYRQDFGGPVGLIEFEPKVRYVLIRSVDFLHDESLGVRRTAMPPDPELGDKGRTQWEETIGGALNSGN